jgi:hypothetical protein
MARRPRTASPKPTALQQRERRSRPTPKWLNTKTDLDAVARNRVLLVLAVLSGEKPVSTAIEDSGISRGFYYQLETKALNAMLLALAPGADGDASPDATGLHHRIKELTEKLERAEQAQRRAERLLFVQRKLTSMGAVKTHRGRPSSTRTTGSTPTGRRSWRSSMTTTKPTPRKKSPSGSPKAPPSPSIPTPDGDPVAP